MRVQNHDYLKDFARAIPDSNSSRVAQWRSEWKEPDGWPQIVFAVFETPEKTCLVDALLWANGGTWPLIDGTYNRSLHSVKTGDSIESVYRELGQRQCEYLSDGDRPGRWKVRFVYPAFGGHYYLIEADAGSGRITHVGDATL